MKAVGVIEFGGPEALDVRHLPEPHPGAGEVRIRVRAAAVSPTDISVRRGIHDTKGSTPRTSLAWTRPGSSMKSVKAAPGRSEMR